jgi:hypothetical protein
MPWLYVVSKMTASFCRLIVPLCCSLLTSFPLLLRFFIFFSGSAQQTEKPSKRSPLRHVFFSERQAQLETVEKVRKKLLDCRNVNKLESRFRGGKPVPFAKQTSFGRHKNGNLFSL